MNKGDIFSNNKGFKFTVLEYINTRKVKIVFASGYERYSAVKEIRNGGIKDKLSPSVFGVGINDVSHQVTKYEIISGKRKLVWCCPYYSKWHGMLQRCYSKPLKIKYPTYENCIVQEDWKYFSNFKKWIDIQDNPDWNNCDLDKDLLITGNKIYSENTCIFIHPIINDFLKETEAKRGDTLIGCSVDKRTGKYKAECSNLFCEERSGRYIGTYNTELEAHLAWKERKHELACELASSVYVTSEEVRRALTNRWCG